MKKELKDRPKLDRLAHLCKAISNELTVYEDYGGRSVLYVHLFGLVTIQIADEIRDEFSSEKQKTEKRREMVEREIKAWDDRRGA